MERRYGYFWRLESVYELSVYAGSDRVSDTCCGMGFIFNYSCWRRVYGFWGRVYTSNYGLWRRLRRCRASWSCASVWLAIPLAGAVSV